MGTQFPLGFGPQVSLEIPGRILFQGELLWMPGAYGSAIVGLIEAFGGDDAVLTDVVRDALSNSFVARLSGGWRPVPSAGFEILIGYTTISVSGDVAADSAARVLDGQLRRLLRDEVTGDVTVSSQLHNFHIAVGWRWLALDDHLVIRAQLGYTQTVGAASSVEIPQRPDIEQAVQPTFSKAASEIITSDVKLPLLGLTLGYRF
ncbi:MAG: hypothetical protein R3B72_12950 [Polyangiaceae bacterium]